MPGSGTNLSGGDKYASTIGITVCNEQKKKEKKKEIGKFWKIRKLSLVYIHSHILGNLYPKKSIQRELS